MARTKAAVNDSTLTKPDNETGLRAPSPVLLPIGMLNPSPYNPREITPEKLESLKLDIRKFGFVENLVVQRKSARYGEYVIIGGHQRCRAMREISIEDNTAVPHLPAVVLDLDDRSAKMLNVALNAERGKTVPKLLAELLEDVHHELPITPDDIAVMGLEEDDVAKYLKLSEPPKLDPEEEHDASFGKSVTLSLIFNDVRERDAVKKKLEQLADANHKKTGEVVMGLLSEKRKKVAQ
jgi:ParB-like chromosome segregation protein Spo0J